jgi:hypothetical protein
MSSWLVAIFGLGYLYVAIEQVVRGNPWVALMFFGYAVANVGLYFQVK